MDEPYKLVIDHQGCRYCAHGTSWTIEDHTGTLIGQSWGDAELVSDICELMNQAFEAGLDLRQTLRDEKHDEPVPGIDLDEDDMPF